MPRRSSSLPSKEDLLRFIRERPERTGKREIARAFGIRGNDRVALRVLLRELEAEGAIAGRRKRRRALPPVAVLEATGLDEEGALLARPEHWQGDDPPPAILLARAARGVPEPGVGDRVLARLRRNPDGSYDAKPMRLLGRQRESRPLLGVFRADGRGGGFIQPIERGARHDLPVGAGDSADSRPGELVVARPKGEGGLRNRGLEVVERLGAADRPGAFTDMAIRTHDLPHRFSAAALAEATAVPTPGLKGRTDLRALPLVTIDGADARDFDDAVWAEPDSAADNPGGFRAVVAIADVAYFVRPGGPLDREARERGNSAYFPDRVVPMLPEALSAELCSLQPGKDRACLALHVRIDAAGGLRDFRFERGLMRSAARLTYEQVQDAADRGAESPLPASVRALLPPLFGAHGALRKARDARGALDLDLPERRIELDSTGAVAHMGHAPRYDSHRLIEELMIAANIAAAQTLEARLAACMYRVHDRPEMAKLEALSEALRGLGVSLPARSSIGAGDFNHILAKFAGTKQAGIVDMLVLRSQARAAYSPRNIGHFGLGLARYAHFTSPIRRYADLLVHRALIAACGLGPGGAAADDAEAFGAVAAHISETERRAQAAERDAVDRYAASWLAERVGATFRGRISGVARFGAFVSLDGIGAEGLIPGRSLGMHRPRYDASRHRLESGGRTLRLGDPVRVALQDADPLAGGLVFELLEANGKPWGTAKGRRPRRR